MRPLYRVLSLLWYFIASVLIVGTAVGVLGNCRYNGLSLQNCVQMLLTLEDLQSPLFIGTVITLLTLRGLLFLAAQADRRREIRERFDLLKPANKLRPKDLDFRIVKTEEEGDPAERSGLNLRPFYESTYVPRLAVHYRNRNNPDPGPWFDEEDLARSLREGKGFVLIGPPEDGKTRTLYEIVEQMDDHEVLTPRVGEEIPEQADLSLLLKGKRVILLLDDLYDYKDRGNDLLTLEKRLTECEVPWVIASTCQSGASLIAVQTGLGRLYEERINLKLWLVTPTPQQKKQLAESIRSEPWDTDKSDDYPTLGSIAMKTDMNAMWTRFNNLSHSHPEQVDTLRALKLLEEADLPFTHELIRAVLSHERLFQYSDLQFLPQSLRALQNEEFLRRESTDPIRPEPAYLRRCVNYIPGRTCQGDFDLLADVLEELEDPNGLWLLGITCSQELGVQEQGLWAQEWAIAYFDRALRLRPNFPEALENKGASLDWLGRYEEALAAYDEALHLRPNDPDILRRKGNALTSGLGRHEEALAAYDEALSLRPNDPVYLYNRGVALYRLGRYEDALATHDESLSSSPNNLSALNGRGNALQNLGRHEEAAVAFDEAASLRPKLPGGRRPSRQTFPTFLSNWGNALQQLGRHEEALAAYDEALSLRPNGADVLRNKGYVLYRMNRYVEALVAFDEALHLRPNNPWVLGARGATLYWLGRPEEALAAFDQALHLKPNYPSILRSKGTLLRELGRHEEATEAYKAAKGSAQKGKEYAVGQPVTFRDRTLTVNETQWNYPPPNEFPRPKAEFVCVNFILVNTSNSPFSTGPLDFKLQDSNGVLRQPEAISQFPNAFDLGTLAPGGTTTSNLVFQAPLGDSGIKLVYEPSRAREERATVNL